jgi:succinate-semialdehyde dehydrogenase/glutarate-semialdehyde dehydrogenase
MKPIVLNPREQEVELPLLIENEWRSARTGKKFKVNNPANGELVGYAAEAGVEETDEAVESAAQAFKTWSKTTPDERAAILKRAGEIVHQRTQMLAEIMTMEQGKPLRDSTKEVQSAANTLIYYGEEARRIQGEVAVSKAANLRSLVIRQPVGVVIAVATWNYPMSLLSWKLGPALAAGCTVVATALFASACVEAGAPPGVVNIITGPSSTIGDSLVTHPKSSMVAFTGSTSVGRHLMEIAAPGLKKCMLELGGHAGMLICKDADYTRALKDGVTRAFRNAGQICNSVNRIFVDRSIYDRYVEEYSELTKKQSLGDGLLNPNVDVGPMVDEKGMRRTQSFVDDAVAKGARLMCGGKRSEAPEHAKGFFYLPTAIADATQEMKIMTEEPFGPIVGIAPYDDLDQALAMMNNTEYGLVNYVYGKDISKIIRLAEGIDTGTVCVNNTAPDSMFAPYPAWKQSGMGVELGHFGVDEYLRVKHIVIGLD